MDEDIVIIDADGNQRNAVIVDRRGGMARPQTMTGPRWPGRPYYAPPPTYTPAVYQQPAVPATPATTTPGHDLKSWIPDIVHLLASLSPLPAAPVSTGDAAKDFNNAMMYASASLGALKRADMLHTVARIAERRL